MHYAIIITVTIIIGFWLLYRYRKKSLLTRMTNCIDMVKVGVCKRLVAKYAETYAPDKVFLLAGAVTNELFSEPPSGERGRDFVESNRALIAQELAKLTEDYEICMAVTQAVRVKATVLFAEGTQTRESLLELLEKLRKCGILVPGGDAPKPETFMPMASAFVCSAPSSDRLMKKLGLENGRTAENTADD
jgi:hypothetical protein